MILRKNYEIVGSADVKADRLELFIIKGEIDRASLREFCEIKEEAVPHGGKYLAYFFDKEYSKVLNGEIQGFVLDENARSHLKAGYDNGVLTIVDPHSEFNLPDSR